MSHKISHLERGSGKPLLFLHGIGGSAASWRWQLDAFSRAYRAIAWDMPGYGASDPLPTATIAGFAQALDQFLGEQQIERPILVGHSIGGMIVQEFLATFPGRASKVVLYATSPAFGRKDGDWQQQFIHARLGPLDAGKTMADLASGIVQSLIGSAAKAEGIALATECMAAVPEATYRSVVMSLLDFDRRANLGKIDIPCLLLTGSEDTNAPAPMMEKMAAKIAGAQFAVLPGLGHLANMEDAEAFNQRLWDFL